MHPEFAVYIPSAQGIEEMQAISKDFDELLTKLEAKLSPGRELSLVRTHLEIACFYARKARAKMPAEGALTGSGCQASNHG